MVYQSTQDRDVSASQSSYKLDDAINHIDFGRFHIKFLCLVGLTYMATACDVGMISVIGPSLKCYMGFDSLQIGLLSSAYFLPRIIGQAKFGEFADRFGRRPIIMLLNVWHFFYVFLIIFCPNSFWLMLLRLVSGASVSRRVMVGLFSEFLKPQHRKLLILQQLFWIIGSGTRFLLGAAVIPWLGWRSYVACTAILYFLVMIISWSFLPESARFYNVTGQVHMAEKVLQKVARSNNSSLPPGRLEKLKEQKRRGRLMELFRPAYRWVTIRVWLLFFCGIFTYYGIYVGSTDLVQVSGVSFMNERNESMNDLEASCSLSFNIDSFMLLSIASFGELVGVPLNIWLVERVGRPYTLSLNSFISALSFLMMAFFTGKVMLTFWLVGALAFTAGIFTILHMYALEVYPTSLRGIGVGSSMAVGMVGAAISPLATQVLMHKNRESALFILTATSAICCLIPLTHMKETRGENMEDFTRLIEEEETEFINQQFQK
ncbi:synaptic vesicle 2-related protein-like [Anneissia japonica]|uniref:synaptic vesicle 2-related protein-like n=1 Tax=Anneissia japonica TaxID=1529436 RepID=UPI0014258153|nr:synaptic vesicle 2-related protein-like [Anneissia japonica]